jgi:hypothetical protein
MVSARPLSKQEFEFIPSFQIIERAVTTPLVNGLDTLNDISFEDIQFKIHKLNGELKVHISHDDEGDRHGLFVHGFRPGSLAEGIL